MSRVITLGESMGLLVNEVPGALAHVDRMRLGIGGAESNVAIGLSRLGVPVSWIGRVGDDGLGDRIVRELMAEGVDVRAGRGPGPTGLMLKERRTMHTSSVRYYRAGSAGSRLSPADLDPHLIASAALLHVTGITPALSDSAAAAVAEAVRLARAAGVPVSFDVNHRASLWEGRDPVGVYRELASRSDIVFAGVDEATLLVPDATTPAQLARGIAALGPVQVVIKRGAEGCVALIDGVALTREAVPVTAVDTVGAGDAFVAGYLAELLAGEPATTRLTTASAVGAFNCLDHGDWEGMPRRDELSLLTLGEGVTR